MARHHRMVTRLVGLLGLAVVLLVATASSAFAFTVSVDPDPVIAGENLTVTLTADEPGCEFTLADDATWLLYDGPTIIATASPTADETSMSATFPVPATVVIGTLLIFVPEDVISTPECVLRKSVLEVGRAVEAPAVSVIPLMTIVAAVLGLLGFRQIRNPERRT